MRDAKSMYRGGDIVEAAHCDFDSSRLLGLVCPFCNEAVYLRAGTSRIGKGKAVLVNPSFCHYPGSAEDLDCERRSISGEGRREIERIKAEKRGQRLELYNKHLWDMFATCGRNVCRMSQISERVNKNKSSKIFIPQARKDFPAYIYGATAWGMNTKGEDEVERWLDDVFDCEWSSVYMISLGNKSACIPKSEWTEEEWRYDSIRITQKTSTAQAHKSLVSEICSFLQVRTSGFCFEKIIKYWIHDALIVGDGQWNYHESIFNLFPMIFYTPWEAQIERFSNPDRKAADEKYYALLAEAQATTIKENP